MTYCFSEWASGDGDAVAQWDFDSYVNVAYHKVWRQIQIPFDENAKPDGNGQANWGYVYWGTNKAAGLTVQSGADYAVRSTFAQTGRLDGSQDERYRPIDEDYPVFGFAIDLGSCGGWPKSTLFSIGLLQDDAVQFLGADGLKPLPSLWTDYFGSGEEAVSTCRSSKI